MAGVQNITSWDEGEGSKPSEEMVRRREERRRAARLRLVPLLLSLFRAVDSSGMVLTFTSFFLFSSQTNDSRTHHRRLLTPLLSHPLLPPTPHILPLGSLPTTPSFRAYAFAALSKLHLLPAATALSDDVETVLVEADRLEKEFAEDWRWEGKGRVIEGLVKILGGLVES